MWIAGVDGCKAGWVVALAQVRGKRLGRLGVTICPTIRDVLNLSPRPRILAVDMPIGLLDRPQRGGRACDQAARRILARRASCVFTPPSRRILPATTYGPARREGLSRQAFHIMPKIREVDRVVTRRLQSRVFEAHPELAFARLAGRPMRFNKKTTAGRRERLRGITRATPDLSARIVKLLEAIMTTVPRRVLSPDDVLDAVVLALTAMRIGRHEALRVPEAPPRDRRGLRMEIWY